MPDNDTSQPARCFACAGPYSAPSGHLFIEFGVAYCGACYRPFLSWYKGHTRRRWGGADFYAEATTSVRAGVWRAGVWPANV